MYLGEFDCKIDSKNRIFIPSSFRKDLKEVVLTYIDEDTLVVRNKEGWTPQLVLDYNVDNLKSYIHYIECNSVVIKVDSQGRIVIPLNIVSRISFKSESIVIGKMDSFVIVNRDKYIEERNRINMEWCQFLESNEGQNYKKSLMFRKS